MTDLPSKRAAPRVAFSAVLERGLLQPGTMLTDAKRRHRVLVRADGTLAHGNVIGSIHKIGAVVQGAEACNGWTFWHAEAPSGLVCIDSFRSVIREEMAQAGA